MTIVDSPAVFSGRQNSDVLLKAAAEARNARSQARGAELNRKLLAQCADCNGMFPPEVYVLIPSLGISDTALLTSSGGNEFLYSWEGSDGTYSWRADFACTSLSFAISKKDLSYACTADNGPLKKTKIDIVSCQPNRFAVVYSFTSLSGNSLDVVLAAGELD